MTKKPETITVGDDTYQLVAGTSKLTLVRTFSAGVHVGELVSEDGPRVELKNARRIWRWRGANTCSELAERGCVTTEYTRISMRVSSVVLTQAIELIPVSEMASKSLDSEGVWHD